MGGLFWIILGPQIAITSVLEREAEEELSQRRTEDRAKRDLMMLALEDYSDTWLQSKERCILPKASKVNTFLPTP